MKTTSELAEQFEIQLIGSGSVEISSAAISSNQVEPGALFIAVAGANGHGADHLDKAIENGAVAVLTDRELATDLPVLIHPDPRSIAGAVSASVFDTASTGLRLFAVTGTNGKTSTAYYLQQLLTALGVRTGLSSSAETVFEGNVFQSDLTTPEAPRIHWLMAKMTELGASAVVLEVSAQAISRHRVDGLVFEVAGFTNLSRDHLDDYGSMEKYLEAKMPLVSSRFCERAVVNVEDDYGHQMLLASQDHGVGIGVGLDYQASFASGQLEISGKQYLRAEITLGSLMAKNLALAVVMLLEAGFSAQDLSEALGEVSLDVPGRLQLVSEAKPHVYLDYAHTPAAVEAACAELAARYPELTVVLAASGDRDAGKRPEMALAAVKYAKKIIVTDQHPRSEDPAEIRRSLMVEASKFLSQDALFEVSDPAGAIAKAVEITGESGAILWCGPGHLTYREINGEKVPFNAAEIARGVQDK